MMLKTYPTALWDLQRASVRVFESGGEHRTMDLSVLRMKDTSTFQLHDTGHKMN